MHLPGEADAGNVVASKVGAGQRFLDGDGGGAPPVFGMLLSPSNLRRGEWRVLLGCGCEQPALFVDDESACATGAYVDA